MAKKNFKTSGGKRQFPPEWYAAQAARRKKSENSVKVSKRRVGSDDVNATYKSLKKTGSGLVGDYSGMTTKTFGIFDRTKIKSFRGLKRTRAYKEFKDTHGVSKEMEKKLKKAFEKSKKRFIALKGEDGDLTMSKHKSLKAYDKQHRPYNSY